MLILTRKLGESITIGDDIKVSILGVRGRQVRLGIEAPLDMVVHREEVYLRIQAENRAAVNPNMSGVLAIMTRINNLLGSRTQSTSAK